MSDIDAINEEIQVQLRIRNLDEVTAVEAAKWLDQAGLLKDSQYRPGLPLRNLLRQRMITGARQERNHRWYIDRVDGQESLPIGQPVVHNSRHAASRSRWPQRKVGLEKDVAARRKRARSAKKYQPDKVHMLLVAEAPPSALERYFYFEDVRTQDALFRYVVRGILGVEPMRSNKPELLGRLRDKGVFLIDLKVDPVNGSPLAESVSSLVKRCRSLSPQKIILIKTSVYDAAYKRLKEAGLPVIDERIPFPGSGQQRRFERAFSRALKKK